MITYLTRQIPDEIGLESDIQTLIQNIYHEDLCTFIINNVERIAVMKKNRFG